MSGVGPRVLVYMWQYTHLVHEVSPVGSQNIMSSAVSAEGAKLSAERFDGLCSQWSGNIGFALEPQHKSTS